MWRLKKKWGRLHQHMTQEMNRNTIICYSIYTYCTVYAYRLGKSLWTVDSGCHIHRIYTHNCFEMLQTSEQVLSKKNNSVGRAMIPKWSQEAFPVCRVSYYIPPNPHPKKKIQNLINTSIEYFDLEHSSTPSWHIEGVCLAKANDLLRHF